MPAPYTFKAIRVRQPLGEFYLTALPAELLQAVGYSERHRLVSLDESGHAEQTGHQRRLDGKRLKQIANYLRTADAALPNTIILAANCPDSGEILEPEDQRRWVVVNDGDTVVTLTIPTEDKLAAIVDGQHRLHGFDEIESNSPLKKMPLACAIFLDLPTPQQASIFATINYNQKPVDKSQTYQLFGYNLDEEPAESWSPDKLAVFLARKLNVDADSPLRDRIQVAAQDDRVLDEAAQARAKEWSVSTATIVEAIIRLISTKAKEDRDRLHAFRIGEGRTRDKLPGPQAMPKAPMRGLYLEVKDVVIYRAILNFLRAVDSLFWSKQSPGFIRRTIGIQALFDVFRERLPEQLVIKDLTQAAWTAFFQPAADIDFNDQLFYASGGGRVRIKDAIQLKLGTKNLSDLAEDKRDAFRKFSPQTPV